MIKINRDETRILAEALKHYKYEILASYKIDSLYEVLTDLENKLQAEGKDERRIGRTTQDSFADLIKRYVAKKSKLGHQS